MKKLIVFILLVCNFKTFATHFTLGTVGSTASLTSMSGHSSGDTAYIAPGNYTILSVENLTGIHVMALDVNNKPVFSQTSNVWGNTNCEIAYLRFIYASGGNIGWQMNGARSSGNNYHDLYFFGFGGAAFDAHNSVAYTYGNHSTAISNNDTWHDITIDSCGLFMMGSFWNSSSSKTAPTDVFVGSTIYNIQDIGTSLCCGNGQGTGIRGVFFHLTVHDCYITDRSGRGADGDVGWVYLTGGSLHMWNVIKWGGPGAIVRNNNPLQEVSDPWDNWVYNCAKFNGTQYGGLTFNAVPADTVTGSTIGTDDYMWNFTLGNQFNDTLGYESPAILCGQSFGGGRTHHAWNIFAFNVGNNTQRVAAGAHPNNNKPQIWDNLGSWSPMDTSHGKYYNYGTAASIDSTTTVYTNRLGSFAAYKLTAASPATLVHGGIVGQIVTPTLDLGGNGASNPPDLGYLQLTPVSTTPLSFVNLASSPDITTADRGAEIWNDRTPWDNGVGGAIKIPAASPHATSRYKRFLWRTDIPEATLGNYTWTTFDNEINAAIDSGQVFNFGVMPLCTSCGVGALSYPDYLHTLMQAETSTSQDWQEAGGNWIPNWNSPNYLARYKALLLSVAAHINAGSHSGKNYRDVIGYVDVRGYGNYGEWHTDTWYGTEPTGRAATAATLDSLISFNKQAFPNYPNVNLQGVFDPSNDSHTPIAVTNYAITIRNNWGLFGWRRDNMGDKGDSVILDKNPNPQYVRDSIMNRFKYAPIVGEPNSSAATYNCGSINCDLPREITFYGMTSFGNGNYTNTFDAATQANMVAASRNSGYRLLLTGGSMTTTLAVGSTFNVTVNWQNVGAAPTYWNWNVIYQLRNSGGTTVASWTSSFNPKLFIPAGSATSQSDNFTVPSITPGSNYSLYVKVVDPIGYKSPLSLAITGRGADGAYLVRGGIVVGAGGSPFNINAGVDQTLTTGTTTATMAGVIPSDSVTLIVIQGESNAAGLAKNASATAAELLARSRVQILDHNTGAYTSLDVGTNNEQNTFADDPVNEHGFELGLANLLDTGYFASSPVYLVKIGISGGVICQWLPGGCTKVGDISNFDAWGGYMPYVDSAISKLNQAGKKYRIIVWGSIGLNDRYNQGTSSATFMSRMATFIQNFKNRYNRQDIKFLYTDFNNPPAQSYDWSPFFTQMQTTIPGFFSIPVTGATYIDGGTHWDYNGFKLINHNMITRMLTEPSIASGVSGTYTVAWTKISGPNTPTITSPASKNTGITGLIDGTYIFRMTVTDSLGTVQADDMTLTIGAGSAVGPTAIATNNGPITLPTSSVTLTSASTDDNGTISTYSWTNVSGPDVPTIVSGSSSSTSVTGLTQGTYVFRLTITDNHSLTSNVTTSVLVNPAPASGINIFTTQTPIGVTGGPDQAGGIELGVKFRSSQSGYITGVRFYKTSGNSGTHVGELYNKTGTRLAQATFSGETSTGWQQVTFGTPQAILANTTYIAAYYSPSGFYVSDNDLSVNGGFFTAINNSPLTGLANGTDGVNGLYDYTNTPVLPASSYHSGNYWVDVVFTANLAPNPVINGIGTITLPINNVILDGSTSSDQDGTITAYAWSQVSGPNIASIATTTASSANFTGLIEGTYKFRLTITDNLGSTGIIDKTVSVIVQNPAGKLYHRKSLFTKFITGP